MRRMTTDDPKGNFETTMNMVYGKDGWQYIRHGENGMPTTDFCIKMFCEERGCELSEAITNGTQEMKDQWLCDCLLYDCPVATVYAALSGFGHVRDRLKMYEDRDHSLLCADNHIKDSACGSWLMDRFTKIE